MFKGLMQRFRDMGTIKALSLEAERLAHVDGQKEPGAEHFVQSALALPDGTARKAFLRIQADPDDFRAAIARQYDEALSKVGIELPPEALLTREETAPQTSRLYRVQPSAEALMKVLTHEITGKEQKNNPSTPLLGAHVILAATTTQFGVAARSFRAMGIDPEKLAEAAVAEIAAYEHAS